MFVKIECKLKNINFNSVVGARTGSKTQDSIQPADSTMGINANIFRSTKSLSPHFVGGGGN
jgi:hypothetical protein